jgi:hypothetical protein
MGRSAARCGCGRMNQKENYALLLVHPTAPGRRPSHALSAISEICDQFFYVQINLVWFHECRLAIELSGIKMCYDRPK